MQPPSGSGFFFSLQPLCSGTYESSHRVGARQVFVVSNRFESDLVLLVQHDNELVGSFGLSLCHQVVNLLTNRTTIFQLYVARLSRRDVQAAHETSRVGS